MANLDNFFPFFATRTLPAAMPPSTTPPLRLALLKGRGSYLCLHRMKQARPCAVLPDRRAVMLLKSHGVMEDGRFRPA